MLSKGEFTKRLAKQIKDIRESKGMSQEELAHQADLYRTYVNHIESARYSPSAYVIYKIAVALKVKVSDLVKT
jgi:transcriptional regulator with XRE-family HTH domain